MLLNGGSYVTAITSSQTTAFCEDTRVKIPAIIQFMRLGYEYQSLRDADFDPMTKIEIGRFQAAVSKLNGREYTRGEAVELIAEIDSVIRYNDMGKAFYRWLVNPQNKPKLVDFSDIDANDFAVVPELFFGKERKGSFRPDVNVLINGIPLAFLEVKPPNNEGGIQAEFDRMLNQRLEKPEWRKYFNMLQIVSFSNNMEYETDDDEAFAEDVKAGSFYTTPNGQKTTFSFFREESRHVCDLAEVGIDRARAILKDNHYAPSEADTPEFRTNLEPDTPCNRFVSSVFTKERLLYILHYGILYVDGKVPQKHIMRYPQFFASRALLRCLESGGRSGIIWHTQGSGKTELAALCSRIVRDWYAEKGVTARFYYVVDRLDLLTQVSGEMAKRGINVINVNSKAAFERELEKPVSSHVAMDSDGEMTVVNVQKFADDMPVTRNEYGAKVQRVVFVDEAHRSYRNDGEFYKNLMLMDTDAVYVALTGTPLLSKKERSNLKFGDYIHKYFYDKSIADGYTLRIKKESIETTARAEIRRNLDLENPEPDKSDVYESEDYIQALCAYIEKDFLNFRFVNADDTIGGMVVCASNPQAKKIKRWFDENSRFEAGLVISDKDIPSAVNKSTQIAFKETMKPDLLIVHQMLTTGYDVDRLKKMYLLRKAHEHTLLQTISRVNRPYRSPSGRTYRFGYIVDFADIEEEYDRTIAMYLKEIEDDFDPEDGATFGGLVIGPDDINERYQKYVRELSALVDTSNLEAFSKQLTFRDKDALLTIRRLLNGIKSCHTEFKLSRSEEYAAQIDMGHIKKLLKAVQARIDFVNLKSKPTDLLSIISNKEVVEIIYEFFKVSVEIMDLGKLDDAMRDFVDNEEYQRFQELVKDVQEEVKKTRNRNQIEIVKLDELLSKLFERLDISALDELNDELRGILERIRRVNEENERIAERFGGSYAFVKTYTDAVEMHDDLDREDIAQVLDIVYEAVGDIRTAEILAIQSRESFVSSILGKTVTRLIKAKLYIRLKCKDWYEDLLREAYANMKIF